MEKKILLLMAVIAVSVLSSAQLHAQCWQLSEEVKQKRQVVENLKKAKASKGQLFGAEMALDEARSRQNASRCR